MKTHIVPTFEIYFLSSQLHRAIKLKSKVINRFTRGRGRNIKLEKFV
jgi:hypothetical protein